METVFRLTNQLKELESIREQLEKLMLSLSLDDELRSDVQLICEEVLANVITHGYERADGTQTLQLRFECDGRSLTLGFVDDGIAFDPLAVNEPSLEEDSDRDIGGLGIYLIKQLSSHLEYSRDNDRNCLTVTRIIELEGTS